MHITRISIISVATLSLALSALATSIPIPNGSFEDPVFDDGSGLVYISSGPAFGWFFELGGPNGQFGIINPNDDRFTGSTDNLVPLPSPADGNQYAILGTAEAGQVSSIRSGTLGVIDSATVYTASIAAGNELTSQSSFHTGRLSLSLLAGEDVIATNFIDYSTVALGTFQSLAVQFDSLQVNQQYVGTSLGLEISYVSDIFGDNSVFDNVTLESQSHSPSVPDNMGTLLPSLVGVFAIALFYRSTSRREKAEPGTI